jgi:hypothetical protein
MQTNFSDTLYLFSYISSSSEESQLVAELEPHWKNSTQEVLDAEFW